MAADVWLLARYDDALNGPALLVLSAAVGFVFVLCALRQPAQRDDIALPESHGARMREEHQQARASAQARALELLRSHLDQGQREEFDRSRSFVAVAPSGRRYRIRAATTFNVCDEGQRDEYCMQFRSDPDCRGIPVEDLMLAQKLLLECDESQFLRIANTRSITASMEYP
jgi:hypothetical protein